MKIQTRNTGLRAGAVLLAMLAFSGCATDKKHTNEAYREIQSTLDDGITYQDPAVRGTPDAVSQALLPPITINVPEAANIAERRFDVSVNNIPARQFFMGLVADTPFNMVVHPDVDGKISLKLKDVSIPEVMDVLREVHGYEYTRTPVGYQVMPRRLQSRIFQVNYLNVKRSGKSQTRVSSGQVSQPSAAATSTSATGNANVANAGSSGGSELSGSQVATESNADFWQELGSALRTIVGSEPGRSVVISPQSGVVIVRGMPAEIRDVANFLKTTQDVVERQVILEAKIVEVELNDGFRSGINWTALGRPGNGKTILGAQSGGGSIFDGTGATDTAGSTVLLQPGVAPFTGISDSTFGGIFSLALNLNDFTAFIELLGTQGNVHVLSSPRVSTVNNQKAVIKVGTDEFFVTSVTNDTTTSAGATTNTPSVELTPFFSGIALDVIPQIDKDGNVILHIHPTVSEVAEQTKTLTIGGQTQSLPLAQSSVRESDSIVRAKSNQIIVIGGLMQNSTSEDDASVPGLGSLPVVGSLFSHTQQRSRKSELVILLRPIVVDGSDTWKESLRESSQRFKTLRDDYVGNAAQ
jgi:MSHA biogenesis protein MshL